jgi:hypothetical protein
LKNIHQIILSKTIIRKDFFIKKFSGNAKYHLFKEISNKYITTKVLIPYNGANENIKIDENTSLFQTCLLLMFK